MQAPRSRLQLLSVAQACFSLILKGCFKSISVFNFWHLFLTSLFLQIPKLSREDTWPNSQAEWEMHALAILIRDVKGASLTQAETDAINDALLGNADFPDFVLQNAFAADVIVQGNYVHGVIEARSPLHTQVISNQTQLDQQTRLALRQEMINNIDPNMVIERYYDWEITVDPSLSALEQQ